MKNHEGIITHTDLANYTSLWREPVTGNYKGVDIFSMPPPSSGGVHLIQMLNILSHFELKKLGHNSADYIHLLTQVMAKAYADRAIHLGDPDNHEIPTKRLTSTLYAHTQATEIKRKLNSLKLIKSTIKFESPQTTHYSIVDQFGNAVSNTYTLNFSYGNGQVVPGTGILLNNEMDDFSAKPGAPNAYGLVGNEKRCWGK